MSRNTCKTLQNCFEKDEVKTLSKSETPEAPPIRACEYNRLVSEIALSKMYRLLWGYLTECNEVTDGKEQSDRWQGISCG